MNQEEFFHLVREALNHLHDLPFLERSPLAQLLASPGEAAGGAALQRRLLGAVERLRPTGAVGGTDALWRRYRCAYLRHVEGLSAEQVQAALGVSGRQMRRDHLAGLEALSSLLWSSYLRLQRVSRGQAPAQAAVPVDSAPTETELLEAELAKLGNSPAEGPLNVEQTVLSVVDTVTRLAESRRAHIVLALPAQLPPVLVDRAVLRQILLNLLIFALEGQAGREREIEVGGHASPQGVDLYVSVRPMCRGEELLADHRLKVSERLIALQGGSLHLEAGRPDEVITRLRLSVAPPATVLVVDDNLDFARLFQRYLWAGGYQMLQASTGSQALRLARDTRPQVITLDVMMPSQDGWEILRELQSDPLTSGIPVVVCSVLHERDLAFSLGAADFLAKPVTQQTLLAALQRCLRSAPPARERPAILGRS